MTKVLSGLFGGAKVPGPDQSAIELQRQQLQEEKNREAELDAEKESRLRNTRARSRGRNLLAFAKADPGAAKSETVG